MVAQGEVSLTTNSCGMSQRARKNVRVIAAAYSLRDPDDDEVNLLSTLF